MPTQLRRDPYARETLFRQRVRDSTGCDNCGAVKKTPTGSPYAYKYGTERDSISPQVAWRRGIFCSLSCHDSYHS